MKGWLQAYHESAVPSARQTTESITLGRARREVHRLRRYAVAIWGAQILVLDASHPLDPQSPGSHNARILRFLLALRVWLQMLRLAGRCNHAARKRAVRASILAKLDETHCALMCEG